MRLAYTPRAAVEGHEVQELRDGWEAAATEPQACVDASSLDQLAWRPASVPGTAADVLVAAGVPRWDIAPSSLDEQDWWFRRRLAAAEIEAHEQLVLVFEGLATVAEVYLNARRIAEVDSMFDPVALDIGPLARADCELAICFRALGPLLRVSRRPRARWRTRLVGDNALRFFRTMIIGRAPGFASGPPLVGPWRPVRLERRRVLAVSDLQLRPRIEGGAGVLAVRAQLSALGPALPERVTVALAGPQGAQRAELELIAGDGTLEASGEVLVADVERWWPHTHGEPTLYTVGLAVDCGGRTVNVACGRVGFRELDGGGRLADDGLQLSVNNEAVFVRGAVWTPLEAAGLAPTASELRSTLESLRDAGMNMLRIPGVAAYESPSFFDLCDELGILVWQDFMFASLDYPEADPVFVDTVRSEVRQVLAAVGGRPSLAVLCGSCEVTQQVAMLGLDPSIADGVLFAEMLPELIRDAELDAVYLQSTPWGGEPPFRPDCGIVHYWGVGGYLRPLEDARRSNVRFAAECLAFANVPDAAVLDELAGDLPGGLAVHHPRWKAAVPRDAGSGWDGDDVRDHYLATLVGVDPAALRRTDHERYLELSRTLSGEIMAEVLGEWRRATSSCAGALVHWSRDMRPGAGWGLLDHRGAPKVAMHHVRRALAPVAVWSTDEGLSGLAVHVANDRPERLSASLRISLYGDLELRLDEVTRELELPARASCEYNVEQLLGRFVDVAWAYRFGPAAADLVVCTLAAADGASEPLSQAFRLPAGRPLTRESAARLGITATVTGTHGNVSLLSVRTRRFAYGVRVLVPGFRPADDAFSVEPGGERQIELRQVSESAALEGGALTALNLSGRVPILVTDGQ